MRFESLKNCNAFRCVVVGLETTATRYVTGSNPKPFLLADWCYRADRVREAFLRRIVK
jgi:hypothetical protein